MITGADALAYCLGQPGAKAADCAQEVQDQTVAGQYCAGDVVLYLGPAGEHLKRCVPMATIEKKLALWRPPPASAVKATAAGTSTETLVIVGVVASVLGLAIALTR